MTSIKIDNKTFFTSVIEKEEYLQARRKMALDHLQQALALIDANTHVAHLLQDAEAHIERDVYKYELRQISNA